MNPTQTTQLTAQRDAAIAYAADHHDAALADLFQLLRIPSVSTIPEHANDCRDAAEWLCHKLVSIGMHNVEAMETPGHPVVYAERLDAPAGAPTVLVYGHYDVQPPDPLEEWHTPPFEPTVRDGFIYARGSADDKGQAFIHVAALEALLAGGEAPPVNIKLLFEGEEESGSANLENWLQAQAARLDGDVCMISDSHMLSASQPSLVTALRGMAYLEIYVDGPAVDLHSGTYGGGIANPAEALARILAQLKDADGRITIPGFYDDVRELTDDERAELARLPFSDADFFDEAGVRAGFGEAGYTTLERIGTRPTLEVNGMISGYTGDGAKTVLPAKARAKVSMRLVANQRWRTIAEAAKQHIESLAPTGCSVRVEFVHGGDPSEIPTDSPAMRAAAQAVEETFGVAPVMMREGGSIPVVTSLTEILKTPSVLMGFGLPDDRLHSPNERFSIDQFRRGVEASIRFYTLFGNAAAS